MMKKSREYKISVVLSSISIVLFCASAIISLIPDYNYATDKVCAGLGFSLLLFGIIYYEKSKKVMAIKSDEDNK